MTSSIEESDATFLEEARTEAAAKGRSLEAQFVLWAEIGRAVEQDGLFDETKVDRALNGELDTIFLTSPEEAVWLVRFTDKLRVPGPGEEAFFEERRKSGKGVGLNEQGELVYGRNCPKE